MLKAKSPAEIASNAFLKLCKLDVRDETEKWARTGKLNSPTPGNSPTYQTRSPKILTRRASSGRHH